MTSFRVGCCIETRLRCLGCLSRAPPCFTALLSKTEPPDNSYLCFDSDSYPIGINNHASRCIANAPHLFEDLKLVPSSKKVDGIGEGLEIKGTGTLVSCIQEDSGKTHRICVPNSLYLPELRQCLLLPQHWAQEVKAMGNKGKTWMENYWDKCVLR